MNKEDYLIENSLKGDKESFENLVNMYKDRIYCFILKMTLSREDSDDLLQETFICVYKNLYKYNNKWNFSTWIYKIAVNLLKNHWKKKKRTYGRELYQSITENLYSIYNDPETEFESKEDYIEIVRIINQLDYDQKVAFVLRYARDLTITDIAAIIGTSPENVKMRIHRARKKICNEFKKYSIRSDELYEV